MPDPRRRGRSIYDIGFRTTYYYYHHYYYHYYYYHHYYHFYYYYYYHHYYYCFYHYHCHYYHYDPCRLENLLSKATAMTHSSKEEIRALFARADVDGGGVNLAELKAADLAEIAVAMVHNDDAAIKKVLRRGPLSSLPLSLPLSLSLISVLLSST
jgi:hypothetical protein